MRVLGLLLLCATAVMAAPGGMETMGGSSFQQGLQQPLQQWGQQAPLQQWGQQAPLQGQQWGQQVQQPIMTTGMFNMEQQQQPVQQWGQGQQWGQQAVQQYQQPMQQFQQPEMTQQWQQPQAVQQFPSVPLSSGKKQQPLLTFAGRTQNQPINQQPIYENLPTVVQPLQGVPSQAIQAPVITQQPIQRQAIRQNNAPLVQQAVSHGKNSRFMQNLYPSAVYSGTMPNTLSMLQQPTQQFGQQEEQQQFQQPQQFGQQFTGQMTGATGMRYTPGEQQSPILGQQQF